MGETVGCGTTHPCPPNPYFRTLGRARVRVRNDNSGLRHRSIGLSVNLEETNAVVCQYGVSVCVHVAPPPIINNGWSWACVECRQLFVLRLQRIGGIEQAVTSATSQRTSSSSFNPSLSRANQTKTATESHRAGGVRACCRWLSEWLETCRFILSPYNEKHKSIE